MALAEDPQVTDTGIHLELTRLLEDMGYGVEKERPFSPYSVDCYVDELHVAFEADGPSHTARRDEKRDTYLLATYALPVIHVTQAALTGSEVHKLKMLSRAILKWSWGGSAPQRREYGGN